MGQGTSSIARYSNDFELVVRATKGLEHLLESEFGAPSGKSVGLHDKISAARDPSGQPLPATMQKRMRWLVTVRNRLVHDRDFNAIPERAEFARGFDEVEAELKAMLKSSGSSCVVC